MTALVVNPGDQAQNGGMQVLRFHHPTQRVTTAAGRGR
jgi:hypothetical protein